MSEAGGHLEAAVAAAVVTAVVVLASAGAGVAGTIGAVAALQALLVAAWLTEIDTPGTWGAAVIAGAGLVAADVVLAARHRPNLSGLIGVLGIAFIALIGHQLLRRPTRTRVAESMALVATLLVVTVALAALLVIRRDSAGADLLAASMLAIGVALIVGHLVDLAVSGPRFAEDIPRGLPALLLGAVGAGAAAVLRLHDSAQVGSTAAGFLGVALGLVVGLVAVGVAYLEVTPRGVAGRFAAPYLRVVLPLAIAAPVAYLLSRVVSG